MTVKRQALKNVNRASWLFGHPVLRADNNSKASWSARTASPYFQKGGGWLAQLDGNVQTGDDWAAVYIPVNEMSISLFDTAQWSYNMTTSDSFGANIVIWLHDAEDFDNRVEVTQLGSASGLEKGAGWNAHEFNIDTTQMFYYGELTTAAGILTNLTAGTQYKWSQFQSDPLFKDWVIYRISIEFGWQASGTFGTAYIAEIKLSGNGKEVPIPLVPPSGKRNKVVVETKILEAEGAYTAFDILSETDTASAGTDWDFDFGGTGAIINASIHHPTTANTSGVSLFLYSQPPTCELDDNQPSNQILAADTPFFLGVIEFPIFTDDLTLPSRAVVSVSTAGNTPIVFDTPIIYGVAMTRGGFDYGDDTLLTIILSAILED